MAVLSPRMTLTDDVTLALRSKCGIELSPLFATTMHRGRNHSHAIGQSSPSEALEAFGPLHIAFRARGVKLTEWCRNSPASAEYPVSEG